MLAQLEGLAPLAAEIGRRARRDGVLAVWRNQVRIVSGVVVRDGRPEDTRISTGSGNGLQLYEPDGGTGLSSRDDLDPDAAFALYERTLRIARAADGLGLDRNRLPELSPATGRTVPDTAEAFGSVDLAAAARRLGELEREVESRVPGVSLRLGFRAELEAWRVFRSDGTDVLFAIPRCTLSLRATSGGDGSRHGVGTHVFSIDPRSPWDDAITALFLRRAEQAARLASALPAAPDHPSGSFPLVIDYALAKGLAHEAFGHASEADGFRSSVLANDGRFRRGERVGPSHLSIVDEPVEGDHAWQPYSANGLPRRRATIVDHGVLNDALSDPWTAEAGGVPLTASERAASFRSAPLPRMTNIRIEADDPLPAPGAFEDYGPGEVRDLLARSGVLQRHPRIVYLSGYTGGQVNTAVGEFVFNCRSIWELSRDGVRLYKPAIFSGSMFGALGAIREAFGPLALDAIGQCGKWGQSVPSSGGSHYFLVLEPEPSVRLGGRS